MGVRHEVANCCFRSKRFETRKHGGRDVLNDQNKKQEQRREKNRTKKLHKRWLEV